MIADVIAFDAIFMDSVMLRVHGLEASRRIRALGCRGTLLAVTGNVMKEDRDAFLEAGADFFVEKPLNRNKAALFLNQIIDKL